MAGSSSTLTSRVRTEVGRGAHSKSVEIVTVTWVADDTDGSVPNLSIDMKGWCTKIITNPGSTAPTAAYDIILGDPSEAAFDSLDSALADRSATATEEVYPVATGAQTPILLAGTYTLTLSGNSVNDALGTIIFYLVSSL